MEQTSCTSGYGKLFNVLFFLEVQVNVNLRFVFLQCTCRSDSHLGQKIH